MNKEKDKGLLAVTSADKKSTKATSKPTKKNSKSGKKKLSPAEKKKAMKKNAIFVILNLLGMVLLLVGILFFGMMWFKSYVNHGEEVEVPDVCRMHLDDAEAELLSKGFAFEVQRYEYRSGFGQDVVIEQVPKAYSKVKEGRKIFVVLNTTRKPKVSVPGVIDNCSYREAEARIVAAGFGIENIDTIQGEKDWVYELRYKGKALANGEIIPQGSYVTIVIGSGEELKDSISPIVDEDFFE